jgi:hypothetical protein
MGIWSIRFAIALAWVGAIAASVVLLADVRPDPVAIHETLRAEVTARQFAQRIATALQEDDVESAEIYAQTAAFAGYEVPPALLVQLDEANGLMTTVWREGSSFATGFVTGDSDDLASLGGAVASDLTVIGDVRDITTEGGAMVADEPYDELILALSGIGLAVTSATWATGGAVLPARVGASVLKTAKRSGRLAAPLVDELGLLARQAIDMPALRRDLGAVALTDVAGLRRVAARHVETARGSRLMAALDHLTDLTSRVGPAETLRLLPRIDSIAGLENVAAMAKVMGKKTRAVIELTGKTSLRLFKRGWPLARVLIVSLYAVLASIPGWIAWCVTRRLMRFAYGRWRAPSIA